MADFPLSGSFRFGFEIAGLANAAQSFHDIASLDDYETLMCTGLASDPGQITYGDFPQERPSGDSSYTVVCRTNKQAFTLALELLEKEEGRKIQFLGQPMRQELDLYRKLLELAEDCTPFEYKSREISCFDDAYQWGSYLKELKDFELDRAVRMVRTHGHKLDQLFSRNLDENSDRRHPAVCFCTVHQAKGLEWETVVLGHGCNVNWDQEPGVWQLTHDAINCLYVAITRAKTRLYLPNSVKEFLQKRPVKGEFSVHQLRCVIPNSEVENVWNHGIVADGFGDGYIHLSGKRSLKDSSTDYDKRKDDYVVDVDRDILDKQGVHTSLDGKGLLISEVLVPNCIPEEYVRRTFPVRPGPHGIWPSRHGDLTADQWRKSFGNCREERARRILAGSKASSRGARGKYWAIEEISEECFEVPSQSQPGIKYKVDLRSDTCECPDFQRRGASCKHVIAAKSYRNEHQRY
eukprot:TRINITY_DN82551_c0_g1_i1.p1 TRINITY_DN82551_c0_g1~~TRINITY_DN82551_c0_g1_i1.p1  ORF type:complete len:476 (-),score=61.53 TRINITY_DN82551_c0_g1_i1:121-1509(-)